MKRKIVKGVLCVLLACGIISGSGQIQAAVNERDSGTYEIDTEISSAEQEAAVTDAVYENYIRDHADPRYTETESLKLVNAVLVKQSLFDKSRTEAGDTIGSIMSGIESGDGDEAEKFLAQISNVVALYELSEESDYYAAWVNTMEQDTDAEVSDWIFALNDNEGNVLSDCIYDKSTGMAYIPKADCLNEQGEQILLNVQVQLMQQISYEDPESDVITSVSDDEELVSISTTTSSVFDVETVVQAEPGLEEENMEVAVNGVPIQEEYYAYDSESGALSLNQSPAMIQSVSVMTEPEHLAEKAADFLFPASEVYALSAEQMTSVAANIELPDWVETGTFLTGSANYSYNGQSSWTYSYGFGSNSETLLAQMVSLIENGGELDMSRVQTQQDSRYITTFVDLAVNTLQNAGRSIEALKNIPVLHMECCHVDTVLGSVSGSAVVGGKWSLQPVRMRFLKVDRTNNYAIIGIYTIETHTQTGCAFFKIGIKPFSGYGNIGKKDGQTDEVVEGAVYGIYTDAACTAPAKDINGNTVSFTTVKEFPYSNTVTMRPGRYYVKETASPEGYSMDPTVKILNIRAGQRTWANNAGTDTGWNYDNRKVTLSLRKVSADPELTESNPCYSLKGAVYGVYTSRENAMKDQNRLAALQTDGSGTSGKISLDAGTYYVREITASPGYEKCSGGCDSADENGIHVVQAEEYGKDYEFTCAEQPVFHSFALTVQKRELDYAGDTPTGTADWSGAVFQVEYFENDAGNTEGQPGRSWYFRTDHTGEAVLNRQEDLVKDMTLADGTSVTSDELFYDAEGQAVLYPAGTYRITEVQASRYYQLDGKIIFGDASSEQTDLSQGVTVVIREENDRAVLYYNENRIDDSDPEAMTVRFLDRLCRGSIKLVKYEAGRETPLQGVSYRLEGVETGESYTAYTDENGIILWENLVPQHYVITEISTAEGLSLLKDPIEVTLPLNVSAEEASGENIDLDQAVWDASANAWCFYNLTYEIRDDAALKMPEAGAVSGDRQTKAAAAAVLGAGLILLIRRKHEKL